MSCLYVLESSAGGPPDVPNVESLVYKMWTGKHKELSSGVLGLEIELRDENKGSLDEEDMSETLGVLYMSLNDTPVCCWKVMGFVDIIDVCWGVFG
jgi:hypothetical protein